MIVCDTSPLAAAALSNDADHKACVELFTALHAARRELLVPATVVAAVGYLLAREAGALTVLAVSANVMAQAFVLGGDFGRAALLIDQSTDTEPSGRD